MVTNQKNYQCVPNSRESVTRFFRECFPGPLILIFLSKIHEIIRSSRCTTGINDTGGKWKKSLIRRGFKYFVLTFMDSGTSRVTFFLDVNFKVWAIWYCCHYLLLESLIPVANILMIRSDLPMASTNPVANFLPISTTPVVNAHRRNDVPPVSTTPITNLPPVTTTSAANPTHRTVI